MEKRIDNEMQRQQFVAEASRILAESIDYEATLQSVAQLAVPDIADWCVVDLVQDDGSMARVAIAHKDRSRQPAAAELKRRYPPVRDATVGPALVARTRRTDCRGEIPPAFVDAVASEPDRLRLLRRVGLHAYICSPLIARGRVLGTITLFSEGCRAFGTDDVAMVEELARRSAMAIDNARLYHDAQRAARSRDEMLAIVSHDLRTPLSAIMMAAEVQIAAAPQTEDGQPLREAAAACRRAAQHMCRLISDLTDITQIEERRLAVHVSPQRPDTLVAEVVDTLQPIAAEHHTHLSAIAADDLPAIACDPDRIVQVLSNLVTNAIKVGAPTVTIRTTADGGGVTFVIDDTGPGLTRDEIPHVFDRFWRGRTAKYSGTGLGLPIAKGIIDAHGGHCHVDSEPGVGTTFTITLPVGPPTNRAREASDHADAALRR